MARDCGSRLTRFIALVHFFSLGFAQAGSPAINISVPALQWLDLTSLTTGPAPPGLKYASIGFDSTSRTLIVFGGEAQSGIPVQQTYLLNVSSLTWFTPQPPTDLNAKPPPRSAAISGGDFAASNRHGHVVIGGMGLNGVPLADAWEFDYNNQFWSQINISPGGPSARYGSSGGTDPTAAPISDAHIPGPNNTFYLAGGFDGNSILPLSDAWKFEIAGVLSSNLVNNTLGSWSKIDLPNDLPSRVRQAGTVMPSAKVVAAGGCNTSDFTNNLCAQQDSHVLNFEASNDVSPGGCPAPRVGPVLVPNYNTFSKSFATQAFMLLGTFNDSLWDDDNGLNRGEVAVLDTGTFSWTRVLPAGDPGNPVGPPKFPGPREGAVAVSFPNSLVGANPSSGSDILVFGGQDAQGNYLNELWLLRGYGTTITSTNQTWNGFGNGVLQSGVDATGSGVTIQYMTSCARPLSPSAPSPSPPTTTGNASPTGTPRDSNSAKVFPFDTQISHKILSPVSVALLLATIVIHRLSLSSTNAAGPASDRRGFIWLATVSGMTAYGLGIAGLVFSFTSISSTSGSGLRRRSGLSDISLKTGHGTAGLAFFIGLYALLPLMLILGVFRHKGHSTETSIDAERSETNRKNSNETGFTALTLSGKEKSPRTISPSPDVADQSAPESPMTDQRSRTQSLGRLWSSYRFKERFGRGSSESVRDSSSSPGPTQSFEVLNRGNRVRRLSANGLNGYAREAGHAVSPGVPRSLSDLNWLERRRSVAAFGELDYALTQLNQSSAQDSTPPAADTRSTGPLISFPHSDLRPILPPKLDLILHTLLHALILGTCVIALVALWQRAPKATFVVFLLWALAFYAILFILAWRGSPRESILTVVINSLKENHRHHHDPIVPSSPSSRPLSTIANDQFTFPSDSRSPYTFHQPQHRRATSNLDDEYLSSSGHGAPHPSDENDEDEETQQRRIEQEMDRRDVSIITIPKRKLWVANPS